MHTLLAMDCLHQENKQLKQELQTAKALLAKHEQQIEQMQRRLLEASPKSPTSLIEESSQSFSQGNNNNNNNHIHNNAGSSCPPLSSHSSSPSSSSPSRGGDPPGQEKPSFPGGEIATRRQDFLERRISSITLPDIMATVKTSPAKKGAAVNWRTTSPLPTTPERSDGEESDEGTSQWGKEVAAAAELVVKQQEPVEESNEELAEASAPTTVQQPEESFAKKASMGRPPRTPESDSSEEQPHPSSDLRPLRIAANAYKGLPREASIELHSDDDITVYPSPENEISRTLEVENRHVLDAKNCRGLYTGSIDRKTHLPDGFGTFKYRKGREYSGDWEQGYWYGHGILKNSTGDVYEGQFVKDQKQGQGVTRFASGRSFEGRFQRDHMREGKMSLPDGSFYEGLYDASGQRNGFGLYFFGDASHYEGQWQDDQMHGRGRMEWSDGSWYNGDWYFGIRHGFGMEVHKDGTRRHQGKWNNGAPAYDAEPVR